MRASSNVARSDAEESRRAARRLPSFFALAVANLFPLVGLGFLGWRGESVILLYFLEAIVVYLISARMLAVVAAQRELRLVGPFLFRYGLGLLMMAFIFSMLIGLPSPWVPKGRSADTLGAMVSEPGFVLAVVVLLASHLISYFTDFIGRKEYERLPWQAIETRTLSMFLTLFVVVLVIAPFSFFLRSVVPFAAVLVVIKTFIALGAFASERARGRDDSASLSADYVAPTAACPHCGKPLRTNRAKQCFHCGADWHTK